MILNATIITGGGRGIGRATALRMSASGPVIVTGRTRDDLASTVEAVRARGGVAEFLVGDVADGASAGAAIALAAERGWRVRNLVCNAGIGKGGAFEAFSDEDWMRIFEVNVHGTFRFCRAAIPAMRASGGGTVCIVASIAGLKGFAHDAAYVASKHALVGLARALAAEYGPHGIAVVPVCPGYVEGEMTDRVIAGVMERRGVTRDDARARVAKALVDRRIIPAEEVAEAIATACAGTLPSLSGSPLVLGGGA